MENENTEIISGLSIFTQIPQTDNSTDTKLLHNISAIDAFAEGKNVDMFTTIICDS